VCMVFSMAPSEFWDGISVPTVLLRISTVFLVSAGKLLG
jgi:hypothetical protein